MKGYLLGYLDTETGEGGFVREDGEKVPLLDLTGDAYSEWIGSGDFMHTWPSGAYVEAGFDPQIYAAADLIRSYLAGFDPAESEFYYSYVDEDVEYTFYPEGFTEIELRILYYIVTKVKSGRMLDPLELLGVIHALD